MSESYFFYDLETSGLNPRESRIMQFAGQRTDYDLKLIGQPYNFLVKLANDSLPSPQAIMVTGITPQMTLSDGISEAEFLKIFNQQISVPGTTFVGYNNVRFDDEFIRFTNYRNFYDPYEWHYKDGRKRWDILDVIRMTRSLRPAGINWPTAEDDTPTNKLTDITGANNIAHQAAHDAMADVLALIEVAKLIKQQQPKLFNYLGTNMPNKNDIIKMLHDGEPLVYTFGGYQAHPQKTTAIVFLADFEDGGILVYDLRHDPKFFTDMSVDKLKAVINREDDTISTPFFVIKPNKCPALAPLSVLDEASEINIDLDQTTINKHLASFKKYDHQLSDVALKIFKQLYSDRNFDSDSVDSELYDNFFDRSDSAKLINIRDADPKLLSSNEHIFNDSRLNRLILLYKARNYPKYLNSEEITEYEGYRQKLLFAGGPNSRLSKFAAELVMLEKDSSLSQDQRYLLEELKLYAESILPSDLEQ
ncbi:MAG TPA: exodeoxyribonuclease I [Candidatus Dormibacteraeota bacterium]|nr:exodeoxyribonuclease I [Candidatus Dormibacteraeota bacterium]